MNLKQLQDLNEIPMRTFDWLNVNTITIDEANIQNKNYTNEYFEHKNIAGVTLKKNLTKTESTVFYTGVSSSLLEQNLNNHNAGFTLTIDKNTKVNERIPINYNIDNINNNLIDTNTIEILENSSATVVINFLGNDDETAYHQGYTNISVHDNAHLNVILIQNLSCNTTNLQSVFASVSKNAKISFVIIEIGSLNTVVNVNVDLKGDNAESFINCIYLGDKDKKIDLNYSNNHYSKNSISSSQTKGVLLDKSNKTFKGSIKFHKGSKGSDASLQEDILLLSDLAKNSSVPLLLCNEDDVKGEHAATVGQIDEDVLFYFMTRGLNEYDAKKLFLQAYFNPIIDLIDDEALENNIKDTIYKKVNSYG